MCDGEIERRSTFSFVLDSFVLGQNRLHLALEFRYSLCDCGPDNVWIHGKVSVHKMVSHPDDRTPRYSVMTTSEFAGQLPGCFPNDLKTIDHPNLCSFVLIKRGT